MSVSIDKVLEKVFDNLKKLTPALAALCIGTAVMLFFPKSWLQKLYLDTVPEHLMSAIGALFIISAVLVLVITATALSKRVSLWRAIKIGEKRLESLSIEEKEIIIVMYNQPGHVLSMDESGGLAPIWRSQRIVGRAASISDGVGRFTFKHFLQPWVVKYIEKHLDFFPMTKQEIEQAYTEYMNRIYE